MNNILEIRDLCVEVDGRELLHDLNLIVPPGEVHALLGPNGCGKTTLMMTIMGYSQYKVTKGQIHFEERDITELDITDRARLGLGLAQQRPPTMAGVTLQHLIDYAVENNSQRPRQKMRPFGEINQLARASHMDRFLKRDINAGLSGGEIKRSELFQLFLIQPKFAMLDEPDSGVDLESLALVGKLINNLLAKDPDRPVKRRAALIITHTGHILDYVYVDKAHIMLDSRIVCSGNPGLLIDEIRHSGYEGCVHYLQRAEEVIL